MYIFEIFPKNSVCSLQISHILFFFLSDISADEYPLKIEFGYEKKNLNTDQKNKVFFDNSYVFDRLMANLYYSH